MAFETYGELLCGHRLLIDDPDMDVAGSEYCGSCQCWVSFSSFFTGRAS